MHDSQWSTRVHVAPHVTEDITIFFFEVGKLLKVSIGFFSSGRSEVISRSSGIDPVDSDRLITVSNTGTRTE